MTNEDLGALVNRLAAEGGMGGMEVGTLYGDFALEVAKAVREECARTAEAEGEPEAHDSYSVACRHVAAQIRGQN